MRTLIRPVGFVDSPFGHDGKVARLAGGLNWFANAELLRVDGKRRVSTELVGVEGIESRFDDDMAAQWTRLTAARRIVLICKRVMNSPASRMTIICRCSQARACLPTI